MNLISRKDMLQAMRAIDRHKRPIAFSMEVCTFNKSSNTGGERLKIENAILYSGRQQAASHPGQSSSDKSKNSIQKNPQHSLNQTLNIMLLPSQELRKIHIRLVERFNNKTVYD